MEYGGLFHQIYDDAINGNNEFNPTKLMWWVNPEHIRDENGNIDLQDDPYQPNLKTSSWFRREVKASNLSQRQIAEQFNCSFNASGKTVIGGEDIDWISKMVMDPIATKGIDRKWFVWNEPIPHEKYFLTADVARGDGKDFSAAHIWKARDMMQVSEYQGRIPVDQFAQIICQMGSEYNAALVVVENNSLGLAVLEHIRLIGYPNVYFSRKGDMTGGEAVNMQWGSMNEELVAGITTSPQRRALMITKFEEFIRNKVIYINSKRLLEEIRTFVWMDDKRGASAKSGASSGRHDDLFMAASIGAWIRDTFISPNGIGLELQRKILDSISSSRTLNTQIVGASKDPRFGLQRNLGVFTPQEQNKALQIQLPNGEAVDMSWVLTRK